MKFLSSILLAFLLSIAGQSAFAQIGDINSAINKAGSLRYSSQRVAKAYFQLGQGVDEARSKKVLDASIAMFDRHLVELKGYAPQPEIKETYLKLEKLWLAYKDLVLGAAPSQENGRKVLALSEEILSLAHQGTVQLEKVSGATAGRLVNLSGRERALSQRMAKYYQAIAWNIADSHSASNLDSSAKEFAKNLGELTAADSNTPRIKEGLELVKQQWFFFETALGQKAGSDKRPQTTVATTSERILEEMDLVVSMYEKLAK